MVDHGAIEKLFDKYGFSAYKWIQPRDIRVSEWVRTKCRFGCALYHNRASCPPNVPSVAECRNFFGEYSEAAIIHFQMQITEPVDSTNNRYLNRWYDDQNSKLYELERDTFFLGYYKAIVFVIGPCVFCEQCSKNRATCVDPIRMRPTPESFGVEVYPLARQYGYPIETLSDYHQQINSYSLLMVE